MCPALACHDRTIVVLLLWSSAGHAGSTWPGHTPLARSSGLWPSTEPMILARHEGRVRVLEEAAPQSLLVKCPFACEQVGGVVGRDDGEPTIRRPFVD
jgi:hypothetical protein